METFNAQPELEPAAQSLTLRALLLMCAKTAGFALTIVLPVLLVRLLDQNTFGTYRQVFLIAATAQSVLPLSFGMSAYYFLPRYKGDSARYALNILLFNAVIGLAAWAALLVWPGLLTALFGNAGLERYAAAIGAVIALQIFAAPLEVTATALEDMWLATVFIVAAQLSKTVFLLAAALTFRTLDSIVYAVIAQGVLQSCILLWYLQSCIQGCGVNSTSVR